MEEKYRSMAPKLYRRKVNNITKTNLYFADIKVPEGLTVDHIFPVSIARTLGLPPEVVSDIRNLQFIPFGKNVEKTNKCDTIPLFIQHYILGIANKIILLSTKERQIRGVEKAKNIGTYKGRKIGTKETPEKFMEKENIQRVMIELLEGKRKSVISRDMGISVNTITKVKKYMVDYPDLVPIPNT